MLLLSEAISVSCLRVPLFFNGDYYLSVSDIRPLDWAPLKM